MLTAALIIVAAVAAFFAGMAYGRSKAVAEYRARIKQKLVREAEQSADPAYHAMVIAGDDPLTRRLNELA